jgi:hypothetical protein
VTRAPSPEGLTAGVALIGLGLLWTLANLGRIDLLPTLRTYWPVTLVVWGLAELLALAAHRGDRRRGPSASSFGSPVLPSQLGGSDQPRF